MALATFRCISLTSTFVAISKKYNAKTCEEHRFINLISHALKVFLKIILKRIYANAKKNQVCNQYTIWFQEQYRYCIEKLYCMQQNYFVQNDQRKNIFIYLIDYQKVFDNIGCELLIPIL